jgi:Bacteriophage HK97-gp10, putative tail-component
VTDISVDVDMSALTSGVRQLADGLERAGPRVAASHAQATAAAIRARVPVRSGRLAATVQTSAELHGATVHYGGGLPYARYIENRTQAVADGTAGTEARFADAMERAGAEEVRKL